MNESKKIFDENVRYIIDNKTNSLVVYKKHNIIFHESSKSWRIIYKKSFLNKETHEYVSSKEIIEKKFDIKNFQFSSLEQALITTRIAIIDHGNDTSSKN